MFIEKMIKTKVLSTESVNFKIRRKLIHRYECEFKSKFRQIFQGRNLHRQLWNFILLFQTAIVPQLLSEHYQLKICAKNVYKSLPFRSVFLGFVHHFYLELL